MATGTGVQARTARRSERSAVVAVLAAAFADDPIVRWLLPHGPSRDRALFDVLVSCVHAAPGCTDVATIDGVTVGAALWDPPGHRLGPWASVVANLRYGPVLRRRAGRGIALEASFARHRPPGPLWYLGEIGAARPGRGVGSALLEKRLAEVSGTAYLESSKERNVPLYERWGFEVLEEVRLPGGGPAYWPMRRPG